MANPIEEFLQSYPNGVRAIIKELRNLVKGAMHGVHEFLYYDAVNYSVDDSPTGRICYISPTDSAVTFGFLSGASLDDQHHLLQGSGKRARHVRIKSVAEAKNPALKELVRQAWSRGPDQIAKTN